VTDVAGPNVIIQAGGKGTRLGQLTRNKPKALLPLRGKPLLFHTVDLFPNADVVVIGDYRIDVLERYWEAFGRHPKCRIVAAHGSGTSAGVAEAAALLDPEAPVFLTWCDLVYSESPVPALAEAGKLAIGLTDTFPCRWSFKDGRPVHEPSSTHGIAGCFWIPRAVDLRSVPASGEYCGYLASARDLDAAAVQIGRLCAEVGTEAAYVEQSGDGFVCRPFNRITALSDGSLVKEPVDAQGESLADLEEAWYRRASQAGLRCLPAIHGYGPLHMERIEGEEPFRLKSSARILSRIIEGLRDLHDAFPPTPADRVSLDDAYIGKTEQRLAKVRRLVPFADRERLVINGRDCANPLLRWEQLKGAVRRQYPAEFRFIHGDPTFSNMLVAGERVVFIDPRGYFGKTRLFGDPAYDWAKLLYSALTNYDQFNHGNFRLAVTPDGVDLDVGSSGWEHLAPEIVRASGVSERHLMTVLGIIWLSLTTYAWDDYDKVCGAFYRGTEVLSPLWD